MDLQELIQSITPQIYKNIKTSVELGKWPNGLKLTKEQLEQSMQILIAYDSANKPHEERVGYVPKKKQKDACDQVVNTKKESIQKNIEKTIKWKN